MPAVERVDAPEMQVSLENRGFLEFRFPDKPEWDQRCSVFVGREWLGELTETEEMRPVWWDVESIPFDFMWDDDRIWLPELLAGQRVQYRFTFDSDGKMLEHAVISDS
eukprot:TRINITY_DN1514_c0_g1_i1.p2 TRINITY_DN1514_c0_g1~~TRINITY_DN1514_c0_g1_i1.p2  ORF type:complete len:108 (-),score=3.29 TRINITY_DN1514_c0_g1_i1:76-399(-)